MKKISPILFVRKPVESSEHSSYIRDAIVVNPMVSARIGNEQWDAWVIADDIQAVSCSHSAKDIVGIGQDMTTGETIHIQRDSRRELRLDYAIVFDAAENPLSFHTYPGIKNAESHFYLSPDCDAVCSRFNAILDMKITRYDQSPDAQAFAAFHLGSASGRSSRKVDEFLRRARRQSIKAPCYLPAMIKSGNAETYCVIRLMKRTGRRLFNPTFQFQAQLYIYGRLEEVNEGAILFRKVFWTTDGKAAEASAEIATILLAAEPF